MAELVRSHVVHASLQNVTIIHDVVQDVLIQSRLVHGFFRPGEECSDSIQVEQEQNWIVRGDLEFSEDSIPDSKYLDCHDEGKPGKFSLFDFLIITSNYNI